MNQDIVTPKRLYRSRQERMIAGVAGGLAQYFRVDPALIRLGFVLLALSGGAGLLAYLILAVVVPARPEGEPEPAVGASGDSGQARQVAAFALIGFGLLWLAANLGSSCSTGTCSGRWC